MQQRTKEEQRAAERTDPTTGTGICWGGEKVFGMLLSDLLSPSASCVLLLLLLLLLSFFFSAVEQRAKPEDSFT